MSEDLIDLDDFLASRSFSVSDEKLNLYEAILGSVLRKYVPRGKKIEINLMHTYTDTTLDISLNENGKTKISWGDADAII